MNVIASLHTALRSLRKHKLRSTLAMLGIVLAVSAVVATVAIGRGAQAKVASQMASLGANLLMVLPGSMTMHGVATGMGATHNLTREDGHAIERELSRSVAAVAPINRTGGQVVYEHQNWYTQIIGCTTAYLDVRSWALAQGASFGREEDVAAAKVCILGKTVADKLFGRGSAVIGKQIRVKQLPCKVIGVLAAKGQSLAGQDQDDVVLMPWSTVVRRLLGSQSDSVGQLMISAHSPELIEDAQRSITSLLLQRHHVTRPTEPDFEVRNLADLQNAARESARTIATLFASVALISLIVGGIGIANVMLVSVAERTREIGIRIAVGARARDVLFQFLTEAVMLASLGGVVGVFLGIGIANWMAMRFDWPTLLSVPVMAGTVLLAGIAGVVAGLYPALRASRLDPIDALRFE